MDVICAANIESVRKGFANDMLTACHGEQAYRSSTLFFVWVLTICHGGYDHPLSWWVSISYPDSFLCLTICHGGYAQHLSWWASISFADSFLCLGANHMSCWICSPSVMVSKHIVCELFSFSECSNCYGLVTVDLEQKYVCCVPQCPVH